ncbi:proteasome subunit beta type-1-like [Uloborus diversus]|uniref:proteasome subunit beta type-1-like n=1 Tax=Uloborus diversus TaxID=327109 RepID=UPI0024097392|nr:proteasome subunit beta type-1-like [Uloborus diversus]
MSALDAFSFLGSSTQFIERPKQASFSPYENNQGSIVAISGDDYVVIASDTRLSTGYSIHTRDQPKLFKLSNTTVLGSAGCWADVLTLSRVLEARMKMYLHEHNKEMNTPAVSQLMTSLLYYKRFFPYYVFNIVAGLDEDGVGRVYSYDSIGHKDTSNYVSVGSSAQLLQPLLDNQIGLKNIDGVTEPPRFTLDKAITIMKDVFISAAERDIYCGDSVYMIIIRKDGMVEEKFSLRKD